MFGPLGVPEILFILVLALLIFGPRRLPEVGRTLGKAMGEFRRATTELKRSINTEIALEDEDEKPRYTRTARPERGDDDEAEDRPVAEDRPAAGEETAREGEAPPRREDGEGLDLGRWTRDGGGGDESGEPEAAAQPAAPQPGTVPRTAAGPATEPSRGDAPASDGDAAAEGDGDGAGTRERDPEA